MRFSSKNSGQVALIILAVMAAALTMGLSLSKRVLTDVQITQQEKESTKAFSAAESGIEEALRVLREGEDAGSIDTALLETNLGVDRITIHSTDMGGSDTFLYPSDVAAGDWAVIWLRNHTPDGEFDPASGYSGTELTICWQDEAAVEALYFYESGGSYGVDRFAFDSNVDRRNNTGGDQSGDGNHFSQPDVTGTGCSAIDADLDMGHTIDLSSGTPLFILLRPFYANSQFGVAGTENLPVQGYEIVSTGEINLNEEEKVSRRIRVFRNWGVPAPFLFNSVFSGGGISTN